MKKFFNNIIEFFKKSKSRLIISWVILSLILIILFLCFVYPDILTTTKHSINFWELISKGKLSDFYVINHNLVIDKFLQAQTIPCYEMPVFLLFAIWDLPLWIAQNLFDIEVTLSFFSLIWIKMMLVLFLGLSMFVIKKICLEIKIDKKHIPWVLFAFASSPLLIVSLFVMTQYDIIAIFLMLLGILMYIKKNIKSFILFFSIAIIFKMFAIFIFIPLVLLNNKKVFSIIKNILIGILPLIIVKYLSLSMPLYAESTGNFSDIMLSKLFERGINVNFGNASLFSISLIAVSIFSYLKVVKNDNELYKFSIYIPLFVFSCFFMFVNFHPYWIILVTPFMAISFFQNIKQLKVNLILDILSSVSILIITSISYYWCYGPLNLERMILPKIFGTTYGLTHKYNYMSDLLSKYEIGKYLPFLLSVYIACVSAILIINFPKSNEEDQKDGNIEWGLILTRMLIIVPIAILIIFCYYYVI